MVLRGGVGVGSAFWGPAPVVKCGSCETTLAEGTGLQPEDREPCPVCGSTERFRVVEIGASLNATGNLSAVIEVMKERLDAYTEGQLLVPETRIEIARFSPSFRVLVESVLGGRKGLSDMTWRRFEELIAELLERDGYEVQLGPGRNDGGHDVLAVKDLGESGLFAAVWQAKHPQPWNKVGVSKVRELGFVRQEQKASKGIMATTTYLTRGALQLVERERYTLGKVDKDDLLSWMRRALLEG